MKPMTEEQAKAYRAYRESGGTATMRAWIEQQGRGGPSSARAQSTQRGRKLPWGGAKPQAAQPAPTTGTFAAAPAAIPIQHQIDPSGPGVGSVDPYEPGGGGKSKPSPASQISGNKSAAAPGGPGVSAENSGTQATAPTTPAAPAPASTNAPIDQGTGNDAQTAQLTQVQQRATLWQRRMAELEQAVVNGQVSHTDYMREQQRFEAFMTAAEAGDYTAAMAAQNPFDAGANAAPRRDLAQINSERARNGLRPLTQDMYDAMPERGAQTAARSYGDQGGQILSNEYAAEGQMDSAPRMSQIIAGARGDPAEIQRRMQSMGSTSIIDDVSGMTAEELAGNRYSGAIQAWRQQNQGASMAARPAEGGQTSAPAPSSNAPAPATQVAEVNKTVQQPVGGFGQVNPGDRLPPPPQGGKDPPVINPVGGPKPASTPPVIPTPTPPVINPIGGQKPSTVGPMPPQGGKDPPVPVKPTGGAMFETMPKPDGRAQSTANYMAMRKPPGGQIELPPPGGKGISEFAQGAAATMRNAGSTVMNGARAVGNTIASAGGAAMSAIGDGVTAIGNGMRNIVGGGGDSKPAGGSTNQPSGRTGGGDFNPSGGLTSQGAAAFTGAQIAQNQQRGREQAVAAIQNFRGMR